MNKKNVLEPVDYHPENDALINEDIYRLIMERGNHPDLVRAFRGERITQPPPDEKELMFRLGSLFLAIYLCRHGLTIPLSEVTKQEIRDWCRWFDELAFRKGKKDAVL